MCRFTCLKLYDYETPHQSVIEHKVSKEFVIFKKQPFLASDECKAVAKFK